MGLIRKYETGELLGTGSTGSVYHARDILLQREVAFKLFHFGTEMGDQLKDRFCRDAWLGAGLRHPNIVVVHEVDEHEGLPFMAMELLDGADLRRYILQRQPVVLAQKLELFAQACDGLAEAHRHGVVHLNIKPSNIFIDRRGTAKILDFGLAGLPSSAFEIAGRVLGTPNYMAPEQISREECDSRTDLFSLAIVLFEFLVYSHPFRGTFIPRRILCGDPDVLTDIDHLIPQALSDLLQRALQRRPQERIQTATEFSSGLRTVIRDLTSGLAIEPVGRDCTCSILPDASPFTEEGPDSPAGRLAAFVHMLSDFEDAAQAEEVMLAKVVVEDMIRLEAMDGRFSEALTECRRRLEQLQRESSSSGKAAAAAAGASHSAHVSGWPWTGPRQVGFANDSSGSPAGSPTAAAFADLPGASAEDQADREPFEHQSHLGPICNCCGATNPQESATCYNCGEPFPHLPVEMGHREVPLEARALSVGWAMVQFRKWQGDLSPKARELSIHGRRIAGRMWTDFLALPSRIRFAVGGLFLLSLAAIALIAAIGREKPIPVKQALGTAVVQSAETPLRESEAPTGTPISLLRHGTRVNVLGRIKYPGQRVLRVQVVSPKPLLPGFVAVADLGQMDSSDPAVAWEFLALQRPASSADPTAAARFTLALTAFSKRFPDTPQAKLAALELGLTHLELARHAKAAGKDSTRWKGELAQAKQAMQAGGVKEGSPDLEKRLFPTPSDFATWRYEKSTQQLLQPDQEAGMAPQQQPEETQAAEPADAPPARTNSTEVAALLKRTMAAWHSGDLDACEMYAERALSLSPRNKQAKAWIGQIAQARRQ